MSATELALTLCAVLLFAAVGFLWWRKNKQRKTLDIPTDIVCLFQVGRGPWTPSMSPFPLKLETFLRMAKIPYMNDHSHKMSHKGKTPWIMYNDLPVADSQFCIEFLKAERGVNMSQHLTDEQQAVARAIRELTEENLYWTMCYETFVKDPASLDILLKEIFPPWKTFIFKTVMGRIIKKELWGQGIGRHSDSEIWDIGRRDLMAISDFLGTKSFMMGDSPSEIDCAIFGMLAMACWQMKGSRHETLIHDQLPNLVRYCERMRALYWPDWQERCKGDKFVDDQHKLYRF